MVYPILADLHTHSGSSGHDTKDTITDLAKAASERGLKVLGVSDHGPATRGSASASYFRGLTLAPHRRFGIECLYGVEANIMNEKGDLDLSDDILGALDYVIVSIHPPVIKPNSLPDLTDAYIAAMHHKNVRFLGHTDDARFPVDFVRLLKAAKDMKISPEINNRSLMPNAYRKGGPENCRKILEICKKIELPVLLSSDSHGHEHVGNMEYIFPLLNECDFPPRLVLNSRNNLLRNH
jgi:putative hydrolase